MTTTEARLPGGWGLPAQAGSVSERYWAHQNPLAIKLRDSYLQSR
jgi:hypothetical protein